MGKQTLVLTPRKILLHVLVHERKHWAQVATLLRLQGLTGEFRDLLFSPVLGGAAPGSQERAAPFPCPWHIAATTDVFRPSPAPQPDRSGQHQSTPSGCCGFCRPARRLL